MTMMTQRTRLALVGIAAACLSSSYSAIAQQRADPDFRPDVSAPVYAGGDGPLVFIDAGHNNFHTREGLYAPFAAVLEADGYEVQSYEEAFVAASLANADVLVIANALNGVNAGNRSLPTPSAFTSSEIQAIVDFVASGGGLLLIADQMPFPGATAALAARFGIDFANGAIGEPDRNGRLQRPPTIFRKSEARIGDHPITRGRNDGEVIDQVASFSGSGFPVTGAAVSLIHFGEDAVMLFPDAAREFTDDTARAMVPAWSQGVAIEHEGGRVAIFGEAAMFTQQLGGGFPRGLRSPGAEDNEQLLLNIMHWLSFDL